MSFVQFVLPEMLVQAFMTFIFLISGQWIATAWNLPLVAYNANKYACTQFPWKKDAFMLYASRR